MAKTIAAKVARAAKVTKRQAARVAKEVKAAKAARATKVGKSASAGEETPIKLTQEQINSWMPPIARGLIPLDDAAEKLGISVRQVSAYLGNWKRRQKRQAIQNIVDRLPGVDVVEEERREKARKAKNARQRKNRAKARELAKMVSPESVSVQGLEADLPEWYNKATTGVPEP